nr:hypothetical protein CFP56_67919 [Quercus suber]
MPNVEDPDANKQKDGHDFVGFPAKSLSHERANNSNADPSQEDGFNDINDLESSFASFTIKPLQALNTALHNTDYTTVLCIALLGCKMGMELAWQLGSANGP